VQEKEINRQIGTKLAELFNHAGYEVVLTREGDHTTSLGERTSRANARHADLFLSIHANGGPSEVEGTETFFFDPALLKNKLSEMDLDTRDVAQKLEKRWYSLSRSLANSIQEGVVTNTFSADRGAKRGVIQVLLGFQGPAALIEVGYLSNKRERALLESEIYQKRVAQGIFNGVKRFIDTHFA